QNSWDSNVGASETLQNGRVLMDHFNRNLSKAARISAVSDSSETNGYIEFLDNDANNARYDVNSTSDYVEFGLIGSLSELAGPVSKLQFTCYDAVDLSTPITDVNAIRSVKIETTLTNHTNLDQDMAFSTQAYIRTNALPAPFGDISKISEPWMEYDTDQGMEPALVHMSGKKYLCAYRGDRDDGWACIITVNPADWSVSASGFLEYDTKQGVTPALGKIDDTNFLCAYQGDRGDGWACILYEWPAGSGILEAGPQIEFDTTDCMDPTMCKIITQGDDHYFLCAYAASYEVHVVVLNATIVPLMKLDTPGTGASFTGAFSPTPALTKIDDTHYLCVYQDQSGGVHGGAVVLTVNNPVDGNINIGTHFNFFGESAGRLELAKIDNMHYLCIYEASNDGRATVLTVNPADWTVTKDPGPDFFIDLMSISTYAICQVDSTNFICAYPALSIGGGAAGVLTVNTGDWSISKGTPCTFEPTSCLTTAICQIDTGHYLCAYCGVDADGFVGVLELSSGSILP
ncbi:MAG: hypothetical protein GY774_20515, partial [Planctomycetes bacterium]|nr:hypothetical protein [Planctomycetota bacterium]